MEPEERNWENLKRFTMFMLKHMYQAAKEHAPEVMQSVEERVAEWRDDFVEKVTHSEAKEDLLNCWKEARTALESLKDNLDPKSFDEFKEELDLLGTFQEKDFFKDKLSLEMVTEKMKSLNEKVDYGQQINPDQIRQYFNHNKAVSLQVEKKDSFLAEMKLKTSAISASKNMFKSPAKEIAEKAKDLNPFERVR